MEPLPQFPTLLQLWKPWPLSCYIWTVLKGGKWQKGHYLDDMRKQSSSPKVVSTRHRWPQPNALQRRNKWNHSLNCFHPGPAGWFSPFPTECTHLPTLPCTRNFITTESQSPRAFLNGGFLKDWSFCLWWPVPSLQSRDALLPSASIELKWPWHSHGPWLYELRRMTQPVPVRGIECFKGVLLNWQRSLASWCRVQHTVQKDFIIIACCNGKDSLL